MKAYYFSNPNKKLGYGDNRVIRVGRTHKVKGKPKCCQQGLHGSVNVLDALKYAQSSHLYIVDITGDIDTQPDKICGTERTYIKHINVEEVLREFARKQALINIEKIKPYCTSAHYDLIYRYLTYGDGELRSAAKSAAWSAARSVESAAWSAAKSAARSAARSAAWSARSAAKSAAWSVESAAWSAAESAAWSAAESAAWSAAESAARSAARSAANKMLTSMIEESL